MYVGVSSVCFSQVELGAPYQLGRHNEWDELDETYGCQRKYLINSTTNYVYFTIEVKLLANKLVDELTDELAGVDLASWDCYAISSRHKGIAIYYTT